MQVCPHLLHQWCRIKFFLDDTGERYFHMTLWWYISIVGYIIGITTHSVASRYVAIFLMTAGYTGIFWSHLYPWVLPLTVIQGHPIFVTWVPNAIPRPPAKRSAAIGVANSIASIGLLSVFSFVRYAPLLIKLMIKIVSDHLLGKQNGVPTTIHQCTLV